MNETTEDIEDYGNRVGVSETRFKTPWIKRTKLEYVKLAIDLTMHDPQGTLKVVRKMDKDSCKQIPQVTIVDGHLLVALQREIID